MSELRRIFSYIKKIRIVFIIILTSLTTLISVIIPYIIGYIIDNISNNIIYLIIVLFVLYIVKFITNILMNHITIYSVENTIYTLRKELFNKLDKIPNKYFDEHDNGELMSIITNDVDNINECLSELISTITGSIITFIGVILIMFYMNILLSIVIILTVPIFFIIVSKMSKKMNEYFDLKQKLLGELTASTEEIISNIKNIKEINQEKYFLKKFDNNNNYYKNTSIKANMYSYIILPINLIINNLSNILIIAIGSFLVLKGQIKIGSIVAFLSYATMFKEPINDLASIMGTIEQALASGRRIFSIIDYPIKQSSNYQLNKIKGNIEFKNVYFKYSNKYVLKNISFKLKEKTTLSIVGETGSGKTTIINLLEKFYELKKGTIYLDGIDIRNIDTNQLRNNIGLVLQEPGIFKGTIMENIKYGLNIDDKEIIKICKEIDADKFIEKLPNGYYTEISKENNYLSTSQKQVISIIRCIIKDADIIIFDEATSEIDLKTEKIIYKGINKFLKNKTCIFIAHRLSTIKESNNILLLKNGEIKEFGSHEELINKKGMYYNLYNE